MDLEGKRIDEEICSMSSKEIKSKIEVMEFLKYNGYTGSIGYCPKDKLFYGKILGVAGLISYEGGTVEL